MAARATYREWLLFRISGVERHRDAYPECSTNWEHHDARREVFEECLREFDERGIVGLPTDKNISGEFRGFSGAGAKFKVGDD